METEDTASKKATNSGDKSQSLSPQPNEIPPSVLAISNLRCPSPPSILNNGSVRSSLTSVGSQPHTTGQLSYQEQRETVVAGGAHLKEKNKPESQTAETSTERVAGKSGSGYNTPLSNISVAQNIGSDNSLASLDYTLNPPATNTHHKAPSVHAHFYVDEALKHSKPINRSRSGSNSAASNEQLAIPTTQKRAIKNVGVGPKQGAEEEENINATEQNSNIDPRLPQDDGKIHVLFGVCGALSTVKIKPIINKLIEIYSHDKISIQVILTKSSESFITSDAIQHFETAKKIRTWKDEDEWTTWRTRSDPVLHIELRRWADILVVCPLTANTLSKISLGLCDNLLTNVIRAWNTAYPILLAPCMVSYSYNAVTTKRQLRLIAEEMPWIEILKPVEKVIGSYGDIGMGGMMDWNEIVNRIVLKLGGYPEEEDDDDEDSSNLETKKNAEGDSAIDEEEDDDDEEDEEDDEDDDEDEDVTQGEEGKSVHPVTEKPESKKEKPANEEISQVEGDIEDLKLKDA